MPTGNQRAFLAILALSFGSLGPPAWADASYPDAWIKDVPHVRQKPDFCGEACAEMWLRKLGKAIDQDDVFGQSGIDPVEGRGCYTRDLAQALDRLGFTTGKVWHEIDAANASAQLEAQWKALHADLRKGIPSIVCMHYSDNAQTTEHFRLVLGYDSKADHVIYHEPAEANAGYRKMTRALFLKLWPLKYEAKKWTVIRLRLEPGQIKDLPAKNGFRPADYAQHIRVLKEKLPEPPAIAASLETSPKRSAWTILVETPFVVIGDGSPADVRRSAEHTVKWAVEKLKRDYFKKDPAEIIDVWLFQDKASYEKHTRAIFGSKPSTPFGYYSPSHRALIMNIATGGGTLVHEIVHPFMAANFPECPAWFNEGLGSLYEQCGDKDGRICGYTNWRLAGLQKAIRAGKAPSFKELTSMTKVEFYEEDRGTNYGQSRYLCYYLQEKGLLVKFYHAFHTARAEDPTGYKTLQKILGEPDMTAFQKKWEKFVLELTFP